MFSICKQTHPATSVEFAISCHFFNNNEENIVTAGANILKVFRIIPDIENTTENYTDIRPPKMRLECMNVYQLYGNIMSLQAVSLTGSLQDALLISFKDAKLSVVQHDPDTFQLKTLSLHFFEEEDLKGGWTSNYHIPMVRVDPDNRCAVMMAYGRKLVVLPFRRDNTLDEIEIQDVKPIKKTNIQLVAKTPILASYIITLKDLDEKIDNIIDIQFLHGYYEPTLLIIYEPVRTFPGRIAVRTDTCTMVAISLNIQQRVHPVIWMVTGLPFDCTQVLPVKKPIGGCLIASINALIYLNQSIPPFGVSLNSISDHSTNFPLRPQDGVNISLDAAQISFIDTDKLVISLKNGELYVLTLCADSMRSIRSFHFSKAAASVLTSCMCVCAEEYLFLGSRLGNSLLLKFTEKDQNTVITIDDADTPSTDKDQSKKWQEDEELEVYGSGQKTSVQLSSYTFAVCDSVLNIAPIGFMALGERFPEEELEVKNKEDINTISDLEIVTSSGRGKNGALCVLHSSIKPHIITSFGLFGCLDVWSVFDSSTREDNNHKFMILAQESTTMILQTGDEINEIENTGFCNNQSTIHVGNLGNNRYIAQVLSKSIRLLQGTRLLQNIQISTESPLSVVSICDPYICVRTENGQVITLALRETKGAPRLAVNKNTISTVPPVIGLSAYRDVSGMFSHKFDNYSDSSGVDTGSYFSCGYMKQEPNLKIEDEEDLLYGEGGNAFKVTSIVDLAIPSKNKRSEWWRRLIQQNKPTYWLLVTRENGNLEIYYMPDMKLVYIVNNVGNGNKVLTDSMEFVPLNMFGQQSNDLILSENPNIGSQKNFQQPKEILMVGLGNRGSRPLLFIRTDTELLIYRVFRYAKGHLKIRFRKLEHNIIIPTKSNSTEDISEREKLVRCIRYFDNLSGYSGVLICGKKPYVVILTAKGELRAHKFYGDTTIRSFASFNNMNCPNGFIYFDHQNELQISILPTYLTYDSYWPVRKVPLRCSPTFIAYHKESKVYCVVTDTEETSNKYYRFNGEDKELTEENKGERFLHPSVSKYQVILVAPTSWEVIPKTSIDLDEWEHVISFKNVHLAYEGTRSGFKEYICIGTNYNYSEDITSRGRILLYDIIEVVPEPNQPLTRYKVKELYIKEQKGPVSAITHVLGFLVTAVGQKIYLWQLKDNDLIGVAFIDTNIYVHQMVSIKSMILVADVYKSISILRFQEEYRTLSLVSRDYNLLNVLNIEYMVDNQNLGFLSSDCNENLIIFMYQPESRDSFGGQKLLRKSDYHVGQKINTMFRIQCNNNRNVIDPLFENKHLTTFGTLDGGLGFCLPLPEKTYRRLFMLQNVLLTHLEHLCGLNPKSFRTIKTQKRSCHNPSRSILDGDLLWSFLYLPYNEKQEVATKIGAKVDDVLSDILEIDMVSSVL